VSCRKKKGHPFSHLVLGLLIHSCLYLHYRHYLYFLVRVEVFVLSCPPPSIKRERDMPPSRSTAESRILCMLIAPPIPLYMFTNAILPTATSRRTMNIQHHKLHLCKNLASYTAYMCCLISIDNNVMYLQPHWTRRKEIMQVHPEVQKLQGLDPTTGIWVVVSVAILIGLSWIVQVNFHYLLHYHFAITQLFRNTIFHF
jgi:hypothetical protein